MRPRTALGIVMILASFAFYGAGTYIAMKAMDGMIVAERQKDETFRQCVDLLNTLPSVNVTRDGKNLTVVRSEVDDPRRVLGDATVAAVMCPGHALKELCLGDRCPGSGGNIIMRFRLEAR